MKLPINVGSTSAPALHPDLGPGDGQSRDDALAEQARNCTNAHDIGPDGAGSMSGPQALADVDALIAGDRVEEAPVVTSTCGRHGRARPCPVCFAELLARGPDAEEPAG